ncbi:MAG: TetR/AcrR family transcriptional regulator [Clostridia bacterium]|nr:TetR/AcrR family transcriptional regulator [Clostridia bacterium]
MTEYKKTKEVKENIKAIATAMFSQKGYDNVKVEDIAAEAGVAKGLVFYHFTSKDGLLGEILCDASKSMFTQLMSFIEGMPPDYALLQLFYAMFTATEPVNFVPGFFEGDIPEKYHYAVDKARLKTVFPVIHELIKTGCQNGLFKIEELDISYAIVSMGFNSYLNNYYHLFADRSHHERFLKAAAYVLNSTLNPTRIKFEFQLEKE